MYKICKTNKSAKRQILISKVFISLMNKSQFSDIKISDICRHANISRKTFYRYFASTDDILSFCITNFCEEYSSILQIKLSAKQLPTQNFFEEFLILFDNNRDFIDALNKNALISKLEEKLIHYWRTEWFFRVPPLTDNAEMLRHDAIAFSIFGIWGLLLEKYQSDTLYSFDELSHLLSHLMSEPLSNIIY